MRNRAARWRHLARVLRGERLVATAVRRAFTALFTYVRATMEASGMDPAPLDSRAPAWRAALQAEVEPEVVGLFTRAFGEASRGQALDADVYAVRHLESVWNRLVGTAEEVFDAVRLTLAEGREAGEGIPELAARVDACLSDDQRWTGRAWTIARTEVIGANNAGTHDATMAAARALSVPLAEVEKEWVATDDTRTRETHVEADGQVVLGLAASFTVGGFPLLHAGMAGGPAQEVINCRCATVYRMPGDPGYGAVAPALAAGGAMRSITAGGESEDGEQHGVVVVALPAASDPVHDIGPEVKHATILYFGDVGGGDNPNDGLTDTFRADLEMWLAQAATERGPFTEETEDVSTLGDGGAWVWLLDGDTLPALRDDLLDDRTGEVRAVLEQVEQYPTYTPHVTIGYETGGADAGDVREGEDPDITDADLIDARTIDTITFDRIALWWAGEQTEWTLDGTNPQGEDDTMTDTVTAAAGDPAPVLQDPQVMDAGDPAPALPVEEADLGDRFHGVCTMMDEQTGDGRVFMPGSLEAPEEMPIPMGWQIADAPGHDGAIVPGRIDRYVPDGNLMWYEGTWDLEGAGWEARRMVEGRFARGVSVDVDNIEATVVTEDGSPLDPFDSMFSDDPLLLAVTRGRIRSHTMCRIPAFSGAFIANGPLPATLTLPTPDTEEVPSEEEATAALVAAAVAVDAPPAPTRDLPVLADFSDPGLTVPTPHTQTPDGRVFGHLAVWGTCHIGMAGTCVTPPHSMTGYAHYMKGATETADAGVIPTGVITMDTGHAAPHLRASAAVAHYDDTGTIVASVAVGEDDIGIWYAGRFSPWATDEHKARLMAAGALSGDWRIQGGNLELVAALAVNVPGFPIPKVALAASAEGVQTSLVAAGIVPPAPTGHTEVVVSDTLVARVVAGLRRAGRAEAATERLDARRAASRTRRATAAVARLDGRK